MVPDGLLLADKGPGVTSFQVVAHLRRALRVPEVGHGGTLDPMATGLLPVLLGEATRFTAYLQGQDKEYLATIRLGVTTDTLDATGAVTAERARPAPDRRPGGGALVRFVGEIEQVPPMYSALHAGGRRLHELARAGIEVERAPRRVRVHAFDLLEWTPPRLRVRVACGSGTYVRSLAADLGEALGLRRSCRGAPRTRVGTLRLEDAVPWAAIQEGDRQPAELVASWPSIARSPTCRRCPCRRKEVVGSPTVRPCRSPSSCLPAHPRTPGPCRVYADARFVGIGELSPLGLRPLRLLHADRPGPRPVSS